MCQSKCKQALLGGSCSVIPTPLLIQSYLIVCCSSLSKLQTVPHCMVTCRAERAGKLVMLAIPASRERAAQCTWQSALEIASQSRALRSELQGNDSWAGAESLLTLFLSLRRELTWLKTTWPFRGWEKHQRKPSVSFHHRCRYVPGSRASTTTLWDTEFCTGFIYKTFWYWFFFCVTRWHHWHRRSLNRVGFQSTGSCWKLSCWMLGFALFLAPHLLILQEVGSCSQTVLYFRNVMGTRELSQCCWVTGTTYSSVQAVQNLGATHSTETANLCSNSYTESWLICL